MGQPTTRLLISLCVWLLAGVSLANGQAREVTGTVTDAGSGFPLPGVNIVVQGTSTGTATDIEGRYRINVPGPDAVLVFSFVGYVPQEIRVGDQTQIDVALAEDVALLEDVVVVGYGTQRKEDVLGSVSSIDADDARVGLVTAPDQMIQGRVAGVTVVQNNGEPGAGFNIRIRGGTSISASNEPLYVIDGVPIDNASISPGGAGVSSAAPRNPLNLINPNDIQSITILKDASATAIYGSRAANGVVLITTKQGQQGRVTVDYDGFVSSSTMTRKIDLLSGEEYINFLEGAIERRELGWIDTDDDGVVDQIRDDNGNGVPDILDQQGSADTDWQDAVTRTGISHSHNLALSGGTQNTQYRASVSYLNQQGIIISSGLERLTGRLNANHEALDGRLRFNLNFQSSYAEDDYLPYQQTGGFEGGLFTNVFAFNPTFPVRQDGDYFEIGEGAQSVRNPVALAEEIEDFGKTTRTLGNLSVELDLIEGLTAQVNVGADRAQSSRRMYFPKSNPVGAIDLGRALQRNRERTSQTFQSYLTYRSTLADAHNLELLGGYEYSVFDTEEFGAEARNFVTDAWSYNNLGGGADEVKPYSFRENSKLASFFGRLNYNFNERYYLTGVLRYDGSSRFGANNKWALFPAVQVGWRLSEEAFLQDVDVLSELRLRVGYGVNGNQEIGNYRSLALLAPNPDARAVIGGIPVTGVAPATYANPDLRWEETTSYNIGIDYGFLNGRFTGTLEYYRKDTRDLLLEVPVPQPAPLPTRLENIGEVKNEGLEFSLDALAVDGTDFSLLLGAVFTTNRNEVVSLGGRERIITGTVSGRGQSGVQSQIIVPGQPLGTFYGPVFAGIVDGVQTFVDLDGDGEIEVTGDDRTFIGNAQPDFTYGFRAQAYWGAFDFSMFLRGEYGRDVFNNTALVYQTKSGVTQNNNFIKAALESDELVNEPAKFSDRWIENGSFLRMDNIQLGYTIPVTQLSEQLRTARVYFSVNNVFVITPYTGYDPEVNTDAGLATLGIDYTNYPRPRTFTLGVNLGF